MCKTQLMENEADKIYIKHTLGQNHELAFTLEKLI